jgi:urease accessory protein
MKTGWYSLLQITDSLFPSGTFAHSYGLEGLLQRDNGGDIATWRAMLAEIWSTHLLRSDGLLGLQAHRAMAAGDLDLVRAADLTLHAMKLPRELREASTSTGHAFLVEASVVFSNPYLGALRADVEAGTSPGNHAIVFQTVAAVLGADAYESLVTWGYQTIAQMTAALLRLGVFGHRTAASLIAALQPVVEEGARRVLALSPGDLASFAPRLEIASMRHERQYSRLFRS